jgi:hypothetical protein
MTIPSAAYIQTALVELPLEHADVTAAKTTEFHLATRDLDPVFLRGYLLGLKAAEVLHASGLAL